MSKSKNLTEADVRYTIDGIISSIKEKGTYVHALEKFRSTLKKFQSPHDLFNAILRLIEQKEAHVVINFIRIIYKSGVREFGRTDNAFKSWQNRVLDEAVLFSDWSVANFIIRFSVEPDLELEKDEFWDPQLAKKATPDQWGKAIQLLVKWCVPFRVRSGISCTRLAHEWRKNLGHMKKVVETGHMTILDTIKYPSAFMLMVLLGVDLPTQIAKDCIITLPYAVWSSGIKKLQRAQLLEFLRDLDPTQFDAPCGPSHVPIVYEMLKSSDLYIFNKVNGRDKIDMNMRDGKGRGIGHYIHYSLMFNGLFTAQDRLAYGSTAINKKNTPAVENWMKHYISDVFLEAHPEILQALIEFVKRDNGALSRWLETSEDLFLLAYLMSHGLKAPQKNGWWNELYEVWALKDRRRDGVAVEKESGNDLPCLIYELPDEIIDLIALEASFTAMMNLFLTSKVMQQNFARMTSTSFWKKIATRHFNAHKLSYLATQPISDWRSHVINEMRWRKNWIDQRFTERTILTGMKGDFTLAVDDNWFVSVTAMKVYCWNCHTGQTHSMHISRISPGYLIIIESTPTALTIAINGVQWDTRDSVIIIAEPLANRVLKQIRPCVLPRSQYQLPFFFKYQSKLCYAASDLLEVDVEAGTTKVLKKLDSDQAIKSIAFNSDVSELMIVLEPTWLPPQILDADLNLIELSEQSNTAQSILQKVIKESSSEFIAAMNLLDFGQWYCKLSTHYMPKSLIDHQNDRLLIKRGISMLLHPKLKTWYAAWIDSPKKFVAMNSRYLFLHDAKKECFYCLDFD